MIYNKRKTSLRKIISTIRRWCRDVVKRASVSKQKTVPWTQYLKQTRNVHWTEN